jgi:hypothetical protein
MGLRRKHVRDFELSKFLFMHAKQKIDDAFRSSLFVVVVTKQPDYFHIHILTCSSNQI